MIRRKKITYIISRIDKASSFEWIAAHLNSDLFLLSFILLNTGTTYLERYLLEKKIPVTTVRFRGMNDYPVAIARVWWILIKTKPDIIHCHLFDASVIGLISASLAGIKKKIFTRHHAIVHHNEHPSGKKWDKLCNWLATDIVAVSLNVKNILEVIEGADKKKIHLIHHGFTLNYFQTVPAERISILKEKFQLTPNKFPVIGVVARYTKYKGIQFIIPAFVKLLQEFPDSHLVLANARGDFEESIKGLLSKVPLDSYTEIHFEEDSAALYRLFDIYIHTPIDPVSEAFGQTYVEALAAGIPSIFTLSGIAREFIKHEENALVVDYKNPDDICWAITRIIRDESLRKKIIRGGLSSSGVFGLNTMLEKLHELY